MANMFDEYEVKDDPLITSVDYGVDLTLPDNSQMFPKASPKPQKPKGSDYDDLFLQLSAAPLRPQPAVTSYDNVFDNMFIQPAARKGGATATQPAAQAPDLDDLFPEPPSHHHVHQAPAPAQSQSQPIQTATRTATTPVASLTTDFDDLFPEPPSQAYQTPAQQHPIYQQTPTQPPPIPPHQHPIYQQAPTQPSSMPQIPQMQQMPQMTQMSQMQQMSLPQMANMAPMPQMQMTPQMSLPQPLVDIDTQIVFLINAIENKNLPEIKRCFLTNPSLLQVEIIGGKTAYHLVCERGSLETIQFIHDAMVLIDENK